MGAETVWSDAPTAHYSAGRLQLWTGPIGNSFSLFHINLQDAGGRFVFRNNRCLSLNIRHAFADGGLNITQGLQTADIEDFETIGGKIEHFPALFEVGERLNDAFFPLVGVAADWLSHRANRDIHVVERFAEKVRLIQYLTLSTLILHVDGADDRERRSRYRPGETDDVTSVCNAAIDQAHDAAEGATDGRDAAGKDQIVLHAAHVEVDAIARTQRASAASSRGS